MALYEAVKVYESEEQQRKVENKAVVDVEVVAGSKFRCSANPNDVVSVSSVAYSHLGEALPFSKVRQPQQQRLVSLDGFRGLTVVRIAIGYLVAALCEIWLKGADETVTSGSLLLRKYKLQLIMAVMITMTYLSLLYGLHVPD